MLKTSRNYIFGYGASTINVEDEKGNWYVIDNICIYDDGCVCEKFNNPMYSSDIGFNVITEHEVRRKQRVDFNLDVIQLVPTKNKHKESVRCDGKTIYTMYIPKHVAQYEYGITPKLDVYSASVNKMHFIFGGKIHSRYEEFVKIDNELKEYNDYIYKCVVYNINELNELLDVVYKYKAEYERVKVLCDNYPVKHTENVKCEGGFIYYNHNK